jgi:hypothetical protein
VYVIRFIIHATRILKSSYEKVLLSQSLKMGSRVEEFVMLVVEEDGPDDVLLGKMERLLISTGKRRTA